MKKEYIGGQAVLEGIMLRSPRRQAVSVRTPEGKIVTESNRFVPYAKKWPLLGVPLLRGVVVFIESISSAVSSLGRSAQMVDPDEQITSVHLVVITFLALALGVGLFFLLPAVLAFPLTKLEVSPILVNITEGVIRIIFFIGYLSLVGLSRDIQRTFQYHGAEHKVISCWEQDKPLTPESAKVCSRFHPRCGTSFLLLVVVLSILLFSLYSPSNLIYKLVIRVVMLPVLAGIAYELTRWTAKSDSLAARIVLAPGLLLQKLTTREPDLDQLEVALAALAEVVDPSEQ